MEILFMFMFRFGWRRHVLMCVAFLESRLVSNSFATVILDFNSGNMCVENDRWPLYKKWCKHLLKTTAALASILEVKLQENLGKWGKHEKMEQFTLMEETLHLERDMVFWEILKSEIHHYILHIFYNYGIYKVYSPVGSYATNLWGIFWSMFQHIFFNST